MKILINDDLESVTCQIQSLLNRELDCEFLVFNDCYSALDEIRSNDSIDLILTDLKMLDMNGIEFALEVRKIDRSNDMGVRVLPKMVLITSVNETNCEDSRDCGLLRIALQSGYFEDVISKPVRRDELLACLLKSQEPLAT